MEGDEGFDGALEYFPDTFNPKKIQPEYSGELLNNHDVYKHIQYYVYSLMCMQTTFVYIMLFICVLSCAVQHLLVLLDSLLISAQVTL